MKKLALAALMLACFSSAAMADTVAFSVAPGFAGGSVNGFTFSSNWRDNGVSTEPFMEWYDQSHTVVYDAGSFHFTGMSVSGWPWANYNGGYGDTLVFDFKNAAGVVIASGSLTAPLSNSFVQYNQDVDGVHEIYFHATNGFWPRLASIDVAAVPEPETYAMMLAGLALVGGMARRRQGRYAA